LISKAESGIGGGNLSPFTATREVVGGSALKASGVSESRIGTDAGDNSAMTECSNAWLKINAHTEQSEIQSEIRTSGVVAMCSLQTLYVARDLLRRAHFTGLIVNKRLYELVAAKGFP
jgi:hypothetical protein